MTRSTMCAFSAVPLVALLAGGAGAAPKPARPKETDPLAEQPWVWETGDRDPFEFRPKAGSRPVIVGNKDEVLRQARRSAVQAEQHLAKNEKVKAGEVAAMAVDRLRRSKAMSDDPALVARLEAVLREAKVTIGSISMDAGRYIEEAEALLRAREYATAAEVANEGIAKVQSSDEPVPVEDREMLVRIRDTAVRLDRRTKVEEEFKNLPIVIDCIVWRPGRGAALINGKVYRPGEEIEGAKGARLDEIQKGAAVLLFKGVRVRRSLTE